MARKKKQEIVTRKKRKQRMPEAEPSDVSDHEDEIIYDYDDHGDSYFGHDSHGWAPYRTAAQQQADATKKAKKLAKKGETLTPVTASGRKLVKTFWGEAWCRNLESHHDYESRLPRGRSYLRNGSVIDLRIEANKITAQVAGSNLYKVDIKLSQLNSKRWQKIVAKCCGSIGSVLELLAGKLSVEVMKIITDDHSGLFPDPKEIKMSCSCPDWATMCKHVAATLYGVGVRLDEQPDLFFLLRGVDYNDLIAKSSQALTNDLDFTKVEFDHKKLEELFGIEISLK
jgi:uncharacterized Zn finger protein